MIKCRSSKLRSIWVVVSVCVTLHAAFPVREGRAQAPMFELPTQKNMPPRMDAPPNRNALVSPPGTQAALGMPTGVQVGVPAVTNPIAPQSQARAVTAALVNDSRQLNFTGADDLLPEERTNIAVYQRCNRSVVNISTSSRIDTFLTVSLKKGTGSGSVLDQSGIVLTNQHVIEGAKEITVTLSNSISYPAVLVGQDPDTDIAILKIDAPAEQLQPIAWGDSQSLQVGQRIYAIGNPFGLERTMSAGMISSLNRTIPARERREMRSLIQVDMSLNQGNSGGPLLNTRGELIGMNAAIMSSDGDSAGVGFAIPSATIQRIVGKLLIHGRVVRPTIGITRVYENEQGLLVVIVARGGPAEAAGLKGFSLVTKPRIGLHRPEPTIDASTADLIQAIDGQPVKKADELLEILESKNPGDTVVLDIVRSGKAVRIPIKLGSTE
jgi:S1-C subfamily serine protease